MKPNYRLFKKTLLPSTPYNQSSLQVRMSPYIKYVTGDKVLYKNITRVWEGPGTAIDQMSQQVFIKHGSFYVHVDPCRMQQIKPALRTTNSPSNQTNEPGQTENPTSHVIHLPATPQNVNYSDSSEDEAPRDCS